MINNTYFHSEHTTVADQTAWYSIDFQYDTDPGTGAPEIQVTLDGALLTYGTDYTVGPQGVQLTTQPQADLVLIIRRNLPFTQEIDFQTGLIDPEQIEHGFDRAVMRDQELADFFDWLATDHFALADYVNSFGDVVEHDASDFATAAQGTRADTAVQPGDLGTAATADVSDFATAAQGTKADTAVQPTDLATVATSGSYTDLSDKPAIPTVGAGLITITQGGVTKGSFNVNQMGPTTIDVDAGGGGAVDSVNGQTGTVVLTAADVGALSSSTKYGASLVLSINPSTYVITATLKDQDGNALGSAQTIDLPLESVVISGSYDSATKEVVLTLQSGSTIRFSVADLVRGLQTEITSLNMLDADLVDDSTSTNKFVTASEKTAISTAVQPGDLASVATSGNYSDLSGIPSLATVATSGLYSDLSGTPSLATVATSGNYSDLSGTPSLAAVATSGDYGDLLNKPTIPDTTHMVTDNTAQSISAVKTFTAANPDATTAQTIVANYAVKLGTSANDDLFAISANTGTSTLSIVGDNANNIIDIAASGAVLNHLQITQSDVTFGGTSLKNPGNMVGADGVNAGAAGLVPAPAATDNVKFLRGDGNWSAALQNTATGTNSLTIGGAVATNNGAVNIGKLTTAPATEATIVGWYASAQGAGSVAVGAGAQANGANSIAIGKYAVTSGHSIQLNASGTSKTNTDSNTFKVANQNGNYEIMSYDGTIPTDRFTTTPVADGTYVPTLTISSGVVTRSWGSGGGGSYLPLTGGTVTGITIFQNSNGAALEIKEPSGTAGYTYFEQNMGGYTTMYHSGDFELQSSGGCVRPQYDGSYDLGTAYNRFGTIYTTKISNGNDITIPTTGGTMAVVGVNTTITLAAANWAGGSQTVSVTGMTATGVVFVSPDPSDQADYTSAGILCTAQAAGTLTFTCDTTPSNDIDVVVVMM